MDDYQQIKKALEEYKKQVMEAPFTNLSKLIEKFGSDIHNDWVFMYLTAAFIRENENLWERGLYKELSLLNDMEDAILKEYGLTYIEEFNSHEEIPEIKKFLKDSDDLFDNKLAELFKKFGLDEFAELYLSNKAVYFKRYEDIRTKYKDCRLALSEIVTWFNRFDHPS
ncbi:hypothetical protein B1207_07670 [Legionella quinlivanii]|uniref:Uncharacterized protein n=1 Tax=Legionella quinlivanii TaxID=45073 RepID=A0A364LJG8_9GAMM|nr:hypothetical protein [Legionella quinlivanii]RAP36672.1 hypothetical protein B1207_07670 [Legionella quinlivanii]